MKAPQNDPFAAFLHQSPMTCGKFSCPRSGEGDTIGVTGSPARIDLVVEVERTRVIPNRAYQSGKIRNRGTRVTAVGESTR